MDKIAIAIGIAAVSFMVGVLCSPTTRTIRTVERIKLDDESEADLRFMQRNPEVTLKIAQERLAALLAEGGDRDAIASLQKRINKLQLQLVEEAAAAKRAAEEALLEEEEEEEENILPDFKMVGPDSPLATKC